LGGDGGLRGLEFFGRGRRRGQGCHKESTLTGLWERGGRFKVKRVQPQIAR
jgi:hypothetical protein